MRSTLILCPILLAPLAAAPRLGRRIEFVSHSAKGCNSIMNLEGRETGTIRFIADFAVSGPAGGVYTVELYVEANSTGEKAKLIDRLEITIPGARDGATGKARCQFDRHQLDRIIGRKKVGIDHLPQPIIGSGWSYRLVLKREDQTLADTGIDWAPYEWHPR
jgi:hypothetical protein